MVPDTLTEPNEQEIRRDFEYMTSRWGELPTPAVMEIRAFKEGAQPQTAKFAPDWIDEAVEWASNMNSLGFNCYAVRNPIRADISGSASDNDIIAAFFLWADCDDSAAADNVLRFGGPPFTASIKTGSTPTTRAHAYWMLDKPCTDMALWRSAQEGIAAHFGSDRAVVNPSRIMRIAGTVAYPAKHKLERGYVKEVATLRTEFPDTRAPVTLDQMQRVFTHQQSGPVHIDTGAWDHNAKTTQTYLDALRRARTDGEKHTGVRDLAASLAGQGVKREMAEAIIKETCPVWDANVEDLIASAYQKFYSEKERPAPPTDEEADKFSIQSSDDFLADLEPLEYLIEGILPRGVTYSFTGYTGHGKTTLALQIALAIATGEDMAERACSEGDVLFLAGENPYNLKWQYAAALAARGLSSSRLHFISGHFSLEKWSEILINKISDLPELKLIIVDSLQAFFEGDSDNDNVQMVEMARRFRELGGAKSRPSILIISHPAGKEPRKDSLVPRGGGGFLNEIDGNLTVWSGDGTQQTLHHSQKFRGAGFEPVEWVMDTHEFDHLTDIHGTPLKLRVSRPELTIERANREQKSENLLRDYVGLIKQDGKTSVRAAADQLRVNRGKIDRIINKAKDEKLIKRHSNKWVLTEGGKDFLNDV